MEKTLATKPLFVCKVCGITDKFNSECHECEKVKLEMEMDDFFEMWLDATIEREEMNYVDELSPENY